MQAKTFRELPNPNPTPQTLNPRPLPVETHLTYCIYELVLESPHPHKIVNLLFAIADENIHPRVPVKIPRVMTSYVAMKWGMGINPYTTTGRDAARDAAPAAAPAAAPGQMP